ncbi:MAG: hypothetical protein K2Y27_14145 [Xanthobacteraceae bacterium]|nr:hypothetical protein [Xanthobacteraceae bacterium]
MKWRALMMVGVVALTLCTSTAHAIKRADMPGFCQGKVVATYAVAMSRIKMGEVVKGTDGSYSVDGTVRTGRRAVERFRCEFDERGAFSALREVPRAKKMTPGVADAFNGRGAGTPRPRP